VNEIKSWQWLILATGLFMTLLCIVFAAWLSVQNITRSLELQDGMLVQAAPLPENQGVSATRTPFLPLRFPTPIQIPTNLPYGEDQPVPVEEDSSLPPQNEPDPALKFPPDYYQVENVVTNPQWYTLDCEARTAVDWAAFFGINIDENEFLGRIPHSDNPDIGFVGRYDGQQGQLPPYSYGVHAAPIADLLMQYGVGARAGKGYSWEDLKMEIASGRPVITWVIYNTVPGNPIQYKDSLGNLTTVAYFEHTVIITGYTPDSVSISDNGRYYERTLQVFLASWSALDNMAIMAGN